jgi:hypothetical protein
VVYPTLKEAYKAALVNKPILRSSLTKLEGKLGSIEQSVKSSVGKNVDNYQMTSGKSNLTSLISADVAKSDSHKIVKHHIFNKFRGESEKSEKYRQFFKQHKINVDDFTVEITESMHKGHIHAKGKNWTTEWKNWIDLNPQASTKEVYQKAGQMMDQYGISNVALVPYK